MSLQYTDLPREKVNQGASFIKGLHLYDKILGLKPEPSVLIGKSWTVLKMGERALREGWLSASGWSGLQTPSLALWLRLRRPTVVSGWSTCGLSISVWLSNIVFFSFRLVRFLTCQLRADEVCVPRATQQAES